MKTIEVEEKRKLKAPPGNIFRQAKWLLDHKSGEAMTEEESDLISLAILPVMYSPELAEDITVGDGLEVLARAVDGG